MDKDLPSGIVTVVFTDIVGSTALKLLMPGKNTDEREEAFRTTIKNPHDQIIFSLCDKYSGKQINPTGDGFCFVFTDPEKAVICALEIQNALTDAQIPTPSGVLRLKIGLHTGYAVASGGDYCSSTVDKAARVQNASPIGCVFVSHETFTLAHKKVACVNFQYAGTFKLKGFPDCLLYAAHLSPSGKTRETNDSASPVPTYRLPWGFAVFFIISVWAAILVAFERSDSFRLWRFFGL